MTELKMTAAALHAFLDREFPQTDGAFQILSLEPMRLRVRMRVQEAHLRPGGTVSGPAIFALADIGMYLAVLSMIGPKALAVTTNCAIDFMRKPPAGHDLQAEARILKLGRQLAVGDVIIASAAAPDTPVARASLTYSLPIS